MSRENSGLGRSVWATGITVGDYDNDGFDDIFITCWGQNILFHNNGDGTFTDVTEKAGLLHPGAALRHAAAPGSITTATAGWISSCAHYMVFDPDKIPPRGQGPRLQLPRRPDLLRAGGTCRRRAAACITTTATAHSPT